MPNVSLIPMFNASNYSADPLQGLFIFGTQQTNFIAGYSICASLWLTLFLGGAMIGSKSNAAIGASFLTALFTWFMFFYANAVTVEFGYLTIAVLAGSILVKALEK